MPELPEVETIVRQLAPLIVGRRARSLHLFDPKLAGAAGRPLAGRVVSAVTRRGKRVVIAFGGREAETLADEIGQTRLAVHLRMTGRLVWQPDGAPAAERFVRAVIEFEGGRVAFCDARRFGTLEWLAADPPAEGLDPTTAAFTPAALRTLLRGARQPLKTWLLRQDRLAGLGNIYASEILHRARLSPFRDAGGLSREEVGRLHEATAAVLAAAIRNCGTTFSDFQDAHGVTGNYQQFLRVYDREGQPCPTCGARIRRRVQQQRSTFWCPGCIKKEKAGASPA